MNSYKLDANKMLRPGFVLDSRNLILIQIQLDTQGIKGYTNLVA